jgi:prephenate dehydratase
MPALRIGFVGPEGTFTEQALLSQALGGDGGWRAPKGWRSARLESPHEVVEQPVHRHGIAGVGLVPIIGHRDQRAASGLREGATPLAWEQMASSSP